MIILFEIFLDVSANIIFRFSFLFFLAAVYFAAQVLIEIARI